MKKLQFLLVLTLTSCLNKSETAILGSYKVASYKIREGFKDVNTLSYSLLLSDDKTCVFNTGSKKVNGNWKAEDFRGETHIEFYFDKYGFDTQGIINRKNEINVLNAHHFLDENINTIVFKRVSKK